LVCLAGLPAASARQIVAIGRLVKVCQLVRQIEDHQLIVATYFAQCAG
jgi:hypothetical protein